MSWDRKKVHFYLANMIKDQQEIERMNEDNENDDGEGKDLFPEMKAMVAESRRDKLNIKFTS